MSQMKALKAKTYQVANKKVMKVCLQMMWWERILILNLLDPSSSYHENKFITELIMIKKRENAYFV